MSMTGIYGHLRPTPQIAAVVDDAACRLYDRRQALREARLDSQKRLDDHAAEMESLSPKERERIEALADDAPPEVEEYEDQVVCENAILERLEHERAELEEQTHRKFRPLLIRGQEHQRIARYNQGDGAHQSRRNRGQKSLYKERRHSYSLPKYSLVGG